MRIAAVALLAALLALPASAQILTDPTGDVQADAGGQGAPVSQATAIDLTALSLNETPDAFRFTVKVADLGGDQPRPDAGRISVSFAFDNVTFRADYYRSFDNAAYFGGLYSSTDGTNFQYIRQTTVSRDLASATIWQDILRGDLVGATGKTPGRGDQLERIAAWSSASPVDSTGIGFDIPIAATVSDAMPDAGGTPGNWSVVYHGHAGQGASLSSPKPFRSSNGEATTYEYQVLAAKNDGAAARFTLSATGVPSGWNVSLPGAMLDLEPGSPVSFPVRITVPFNHVHGAAVSMTLRLQQVGNGTAWATLELGVHYTTIPQPAGHHPTLYLHSEDWSQTAYLVNPAVGSPTGAMTMNPMDSDLADTQKGVEGQAGLGGTSATWRWGACLSPQLAIGIDMNLTATGSFSIPITSTRPLKGATITGRLIHIGPGGQVGQWCYNWGNGKQTILADIAGTPQDIAPGAPTVLTGKITANAAGDYIPYQDGAQMVLELILTTSDPAVGGAEGPFMEPGAWLTVPFNEYHEAAKSGFVDANEGAPAPGFVAPEAPKSSPAAGPLVALGLAAVAVVARRRK